MKHRERIEKFGKFIASVYEHFLCCIMVLTLKLFVFYEKLAIK